jgi:hypothetical protein
MSEHWYVEEQPNGTVLVWSRATDSGDEDKYVVAVAGVGPKVDRLALAHRIAALPDALQALQQVMGWIKGWDPNFIYDDEWPEAEAAAKDAIAKLTGAPTVHARADHG